MSGFLPRNLAVLACKHVAQNTRPILWIAHDDEWMFLCGASDHGPDDWMLVSVGGLQDNDPSIAECAGLGHGHAAVRDTATSPWIYDSGPDEDG